MRDWEPASTGGGNRRLRGGYVAAAEKAIFDTAYVRAAAGGKAFFTELYLPRDFDRREIRRWIDRIESPRLRTMVSRRTREALRKAESE